MLDEPLVYLLWRQLHCRVAMFGTDKRWKHLSAKPTSRWVFHWGSLKMTTLIGYRWKCSNVCSRVVLMTRKLPYFSQIMLRRLPESEIWRRDKLRKMIISTNSNTSFYFQSQWNIRNIDDLQKGEKSKKRKAVIARVFHLFPFRTEKLSPLAPMVLELNLGE